MGWFLVKPRYTSGSPASVDERTANEVCVNERRACELARQGIGTDEAVALAQGPNPLKGIVLHHARSERRNRQTGNLYEDLLTGEHIWEPALNPDGSEIPPHCVFDEDHEMDMRTVHFQAHGNHVAVEGRCVHCRQVGRAVLTTAWRGA